MTKKEIQQKLGCFNPCFIGTYSFTYKKIIYQSTKIVRFNPCFIGTYSFTSSSTWHDIASTKF